ncbi:MAG: hypothetical protein ABL879_18165 [Devosia sp.]
MSKLYFVLWGTPSERHGYVLDPVDMQSGVSINREIVAPLACVMEAMMDRCGDWSEASRGGRSRAADPSIAARSKLR